MALTIERAAEVTKFPTEPIFSPHGYIIAEDGTVYTLTRQWWHGAVLAILYPQLLAEFRIDMETDDDNNPVPGTGTVLELPDDPDELNVFDFQKFEHHVHGKLTVIRVCPARLLGPPSVDLPKAAATPEQLIALHIVFKIMGLKQASEVATDFCDMNVKRCLSMASLAVDERRTQW